MSNPPVPAPASPSTFRRTGALLTVTAVTAAGLALVPSAANAAVSADAPVVISEVYGGGGNSGAAFNRDFIELANTGDETVDLSGFSVQYASATGATWQVTKLGDVDLPAGENLLVGQAFGSNTSLPAFEADVDGSIAMSGSGAKVALVSTETALTGSTGIADLDQVVDLVGWGSTASAFAGSAPAPGTSNATSVSRDEDASNSADNAADFAAGAPTPTGLGADVDPEPEPEPEPEPQVATIAEIQGETDASPLAGRTVTTTGVVTAHYPTGGYNGYVIQTPGTGGALDLETHTASDAVFVYAPGAVREVALGDTVTVTGVVSEYNGLTEITVEAGDARVIEDAEAPAPATVAWPTTAAQRESLESMLIAPQGAFTVSDTCSGPPGRSSR